MSRSGHVLSIVGVLLLGGWSWLEAPNERVAEGNRHFSEGRFDAALEDYRSADTSPGTEPALRFDEGAALYRLAEKTDDPEASAELLAGAETAFHGAARADDPILRSSAYHNLGNVLYRSERFDEAVEAYKQALRVNPDNDNARYNLELAQREGERRSRRAGRDRKGPPRPDPGGDDPSGPGGQGQDGAPGQPPRERRGAGPPSKERGQGGEPQDRRGGDARGERADPDGAEADERADRGSPEPDERPEDGHRDRDPEDEQGGREPEGREPERPLEGERGGLPGEVGRKLDALERLSRDLRHRSLRNADRADERGRPEKDW